MSPHLATCPVCNCPFLFSWSSVPVMPDQVCSAGCAWETGGTRGACERGDYCHPPNNSLPHRPTAPPSPAPFPGTHHPGLPSPNKSRSRVSLGAGCNARQLTNLHGPPPLLLMYSVTDSTGPHECTQRHNSICREGLPKGGGGLWSSTA